MESREALLEGSCIERYKTYNFINWCGLPTSVSLSLLTLKDECQEDGKNWLFQCRRQQNQVLWLQCGDQLERPSKFLSRWDCGEKTVSENNWLSCATLPVLKGQPEQSGKTRLHLLTWLHFDDKESALPPLERHLGESVQESQKIEVVSPFEWFVLPVFQNETRRLETSATKNCSDDTSWYKAREGCTKCLSNRGNTCIAWMESSLTKWRLLWPSVLLLLTDS